MFHFWFLCVLPVFLPLPSIATFNLTTSGHRISSSASALRSSSLIRPHSSGRKRTNQGRIIAGTLAKEGTFPFIVSLMESPNRHFCGGSILDSRHILTAAHCMFHIDPTLKRLIKRTPSTFFVYIGHLSIDIAAIKSGDLFEIESLTTHGDFSMDHLADGNDVAVLRLKKAINFNHFGSRRAASICLASEGSVPMAKHCKIIGWGAMDPKVEAPVTELRFGTIALMDAKHCKAFGYVNEKRILCAGSEGSEGGGLVVDACQGDSGGPLVCPVDSRDSELIQFGIVSWGIGCGRNVGYYTKVAHYVNWILEAIEGGRDLDSGYDEESDEESDEGTTDSNDEDDDDGEDGDTDGPTDETTDGTQDSTTDAKHRFKYRRNN